MIDRITPYALWFFRLALGTAFIGHVVANFFGYIPPDVSKVFGLPPGVSGFAIAWELLVGVALIVGIWPRAAAIAGTATLIAALLAASGGPAHIDPAYAWQHPAMLLVALIAFAVAGDGAFALVPTNSGGPTRNRR